MRQHFTPQGIKLAIGSLGIGALALPIAEGACLLGGRRAPRPRSATKPANPFWMKSEDGRRCRFHRRGKTPLCPLLRNRAIPTIPKLVPKKQGTRFGVMILDEERGRHGPPTMEGANAPYEDWLCQCFYPLPVPHKKRTSYKRFVNASGVRSKKPRVPDLAQ